MRRRDVIKIIAGSATGWPITARTQQSERKRLVGVLMGFSEQAGQSLVTTFRDALGTLGWIEGANLKIELRWGGGDASRIGTFAKELVDLHPDAILAQTTPVAVAIAHETKAIPIVFVTVSDPIGSGVIVEPGNSSTAAILYAFYSSCRVVLCDRGEHRPSAQQGGNRTRYCQTGK
jgi:putative ABC transport system substrate-binding protein